MLSLKKYLGRKEGWRSTSETGGGVTHSFKADGLVLRAFIYATLLVIPKTPVRSTLSFYKWFREDKESAPSHSRLPVPSVNLSVAGQPPISVPFPAPCLSPATLNH